MSVQDPCSFFFKMLASCSAPYVAQSSYYQLFTEYTPNNKLKSNFVKMAKENSKINLLLSTILRDTVHDVFLKPSIVPDHAPKSVMELINQVHRDGFYLLRCRASLVIFLRDQDELIDNERNGISALEKLCSQLYSIKSSENLNYYISDEEFNLRPFVALTFIDFFPLIQKLLLKNIIIFFNNLDQLSGNTNKFIDLSSFKNLFMLELLKILRYGNVTKGDYHPKILQSIFIKENADLVSEEEQAKRTIKTIITDKTGINPDPTANFVEIINHPNVGDLIQSIGFDINVFCFQIKQQYIKFYNIVDDDDNELLVNNIISNGNPSRQETVLSNLLNEICLSMLNSCFHGKCLILTDDYDAKIVIDFQQINSLDKYFTIPILSLVGLSTKTFLEVLMKISDPDTVATSLNSGFVHWSKLKLVFQSISFNENYQFGRIIVCQSGLRRDDNSPTKRMYLEPHASIEIFPNGCLDSGTYDSDSTLLISVQNGKMKRVPFEEFIVGDTSATTDIVGTFLIQVVS